MFEMDPKTEISHTERIAVDEHHSTTISDARKLYEGTRANSPIVFLTDQVAEAGDGRNVARLLLPRPTADPKDPLTWRPWRKYVATLSISYFIFLSYYTTNSISPVLYSITTEFDCSLTEASWLITFNVLFLGIGNLFWIPLSRKIGKRPVVLLSVALFFAANIWAAVAQGFGSFFAARIVQGFGASASESLAPAVVADLFFLHERGLWIGVAMFMIACGASLGSVFGGLVGSSTPDWRWVIWMDVILTGVCLLIVIFFQAETNFRRPTESEIGGGLHPSELEDLCIRSNSSWAKSLGVTDWYDRETSIWRLWWTPWLTLKYSAVGWASLFIGVNLGGFVLISVVNAGIFPELYDFNALSVGYISIGYLIAGAIGCFVGGPLSDWIATTIAKRRDGWFLPEYRLWCLGPSAVFLPVGCLMWGGGLHSRLSPFVSIIGASISYGITCAIPAVCIAYVVDYHRPVTGEATTMLTAFKNTFAFAVSFAAFPWLQKDGIFAMSGYLLLIEGVVFLTVLPMYLYGHRLFQWRMKPSDMEA